MIFKIFEDEANNTSLGISNAFYKLKDSIATLIARPSSTSSFEFSDGFAESIKADRDAITQYIEAVKQGMSTTDALAKCFGSASTDARNFAAELQGVSSMSTAEASNAIALFEKNKKISQVSMQAQGKSISNVKTIIDEYNAILTDSAHAQDANYKAISKSGLGQKEFLGAIQKTNPPLAKYLSQTKSLNGSVRGYIGSLIAAKAATIGLRVVTTALNTILGMMSGIIASGVIMGLQKLWELVSGLIVTQKKALEAAKEAREAYDEEASKIKDLSTKLEEAKQKYDELYRRQQAQGLTFVEQDELDKLKETNEQLSMQIENEKELQRVQAGNANKKLVNAYNRQAYKSIQSTNALYDYNALKERNQELFDFYSDLEKNARLYADEQKMSDEEFAEYYQGLIDNIGEYENLISQLDALKKQYDPDEGAMQAEMLDYDAYIKEVVTRYNELNRLKEDGVTLSSEQADQLNHIREDILVPMMSSLKTDYIDEYVGDDDIVAGWKVLYDLIGKALYGAEFFEQKLSELPDGLQEKLKNLGAQGKLTADSVTELAESYPALESWMNRSGYTAQEVAKYYNALKKSGDALKISNNATAEETVNKLNTLSKGFEQLDKIYKDVTDGGGFDVNLIADNKDFKEKFSSLKSYTDFLSTIVKYPDDIKACQDAFNRLTSEYVINSGVLDILNEDNKELVTNYLKVMGVENAAEMVDAKLSYQKEKLRLSTKKYVDATLDEVTAEFNAASASDVARQALAELWLQKVDLNTYKIDSSSDIDQIINMANAANAATASIAALQRAKNVLEAVENGTVAGFHMLESGEYDKALEIIDQINNGTFNYDFQGIDASKFKSAVYTGGNKSAQTGESAAEKAAREAKEAFTNEYNAHKHKVQMELETEKAYYDWLEKRSKEVYDNKIIDEGDYWKYQEEVFSGRRNLFKDYLSDVEHYISMLSNRGGQDDKILTLYKKLIVETKEKLQKAYMSGLGADNGYVQELQNKLQTYKNNIISTLDDVVKKANEVVDGFQNVYTTLTDAAKEYTTNGYLSVDSLQKILDLSPKYLEMLADENGQLVVNEQALQKIIAAKTEEMGAETALAYAKKILFATEQNEISTLETLANVNAAASHATWDMAYATVGLARAIGTANGIDTSYYDNAVSYITKMRSLTKTAVNSVSAYYETLSKEASDSYGSQKDALETILKLTEDMIQKENEDLIQSLEDQKDKYAEIIEKKKELINLAKEEDDHNASINEKLQKASKLQAQIAALSLDDSRSAAAEKKSLEEELTSLQKEIADEQNNYYVDAQLDALDDELDAFNDAKDKEIENQRNMLSSTEKLYRAAIDRIENNWDTLYQDLLSWNYEYGSTLQDDLISAWDAASDAVKRYGSFVAAVNGGGAGTAHIGDGSAENIVGSMRDNSERWLTASASERKRLEADNLAKAEGYRRATGDNIRLGNDGVWYHENGEKLYSLSKDDKARSIVARMKNNSKLWSSADESEREALVAENERLAQTLEGVLGKRITKDMNGTWWIDGKKLYSVYHKGGIAGDAPSLKQNEVMAVLEKGEAVLDANREKGLYKIVDFVSVLSDKLGKTLDEANINRVFNMTPKLDVHSILSNGIKGAVADIAAAGIDRNYTIEHIDVTAPVSVVQKLDTEEIKRHARTIGSVSAEYIKEGFSKRGINSKTSKF